MYKNYRQEAETAQLQSILGSVVVEKKDGKERISLGGRRNVKGIYWKMICDMKDQKSETRTVDHVVRRAKTTRKRRRSKEALERRRERYFSRKPKGRDTVTVLIQGDTQ
jgi:hypothetical protein